MKNGWYGPLNRLTGKHTCLHLHRVCSISFCCFCYTISYSHDCVCVCVCECVCTWLGSC
ncbi:hypothetical protein LDENG_00250100, partial [Lucifuga dentata]